MSELRTGVFGQVLTAMVTPFDADGALDLDGGRHDRLRRTVAEVLDADQRALRAHPEADRHR